MINKSHYFFLLGLNPWPFIMSLCSFNMMISLLMFFKFLDMFIFFINLGLLIMCCLFWWNCYSGEFNIEGKSSFVLETGVKMSMILFISSEVFFFFSFFWAYFHYFLSPTLEVGMSWPPLNVEMFDFSNVPLINTLVLMASGVTVTVSHFFLINNEMKKSNFWIFCTFSLGLFFSYLQKLEYENSFFSISDGNFGTSFFVLTGFHGIHVLIGSLFLFMVFFRSMFLSSAAKNSLSFEMASWYWHFVDVVWIFLYFFLYYLNY